MGEMIFIWNYIFAKITYISSIEIQISILIAFNCSFYTVKTLIEFKAVQNIFEIILLFSILMALILLMKMNEF